MNNSSTNPIDLTVAESSRLLKRVLKAAFPAVKFSVRKGSGTAYDSLYVEWKRPEDETEAAELRGAVSKIANKFQSRHFDGMTDSTSHSVALVEFEGKVFRSSAGYVLCFGV